MSMRRTLILDEEDLIMVVKEDVVKQIDENRGELNRTEFVNYLIQCQLKECNKQDQYVTKEELHKSVREITELMQNFLQFFVSYGMAMGSRQPAQELQVLNRQLEALDVPGPDAGREGL
ncbi:hypothetical protein ACFLX3_01260 [Chloroflexota bacterium]